MIVVIDKGWKDEKSCRETEEESNEGRTAREADFPNYDQTPYDAPNKSQTQIQDEMTDRHPFLFFICC